MTPRATARWLWRHREAILALAVLAGVVRAIFFFWAHDHLPQPFFYEPFDTWMDWFNTAYWAHNPGAYDSWGTVYPPLSFVMLRVLGKASCYVQANGYSGRECDWIGLVSLHGFFVLNIVLLFFSFRRIDRATALWRALGLGLGLPSLYGLERGNMIVPCFTCVILGFGPLLRSARARWLVIGMAINFKVYLVSALFPQLLRRRWRWFEGAAIATLAVYLVTYGLMGAGTPAEIFTNIRDFSGLYQAITFLDLWYAATYIPLLSLLDGQYGTMIGVLGSQTVDLLLIVIPAMVHLTQALIAAAALAAWLRPETVSPHRLTFLGVAMAMITAEPGGYTQNILIFFVFMERGHGFARNWAILVCYILCLPFDIIIGQVPPLIQESYLAGRQTFFQYYITVGPFLRPLLILSLAWALSALTVQEVWSDIQRQGWRYRWRYRHDAPIMVGEGSVIVPPDHGIASERSGT